MRSVVAKGLGLAAVLALAACLAWSTSVPVQQAAALPPPGIAPSQAGTQADGQVLASGEALAVDDGLRRRFDYYLVGIGERPLPALLAEIDRDLAASLPASAAAEASRLLRRYVDYKRALAELKVANATGDDPASLSARLHAQRKLRDRFFSAAESRGLFAWQDAFDDDALARFAIQHDGQLDAAAREQKLAELARYQAPELQAARQAPVQYLALDDAVKAARSKGADEAAIYRLRSNAVGEEAATRLAALDRDEAAWQQRVDGYLLERKNIQSNSQLSTSQRDAALASLRDSRFNATEQLRLTVHEEQLH
ncbi:lipase secretion chaperone [Chitinimonas sp.]|uniref:lipase secretion chaperone n=1 Tax=Chitinimonas sp. TaxID=1934313 RepID=UPI0035B06C2B